MAQTRRAAETVGQRLARARRRAGLSQLRLAAAAGCSESYVSKVERDVLVLNDLRLARRLAAVLNLPLADLLRVGPMRSPVEAAGGSGGQGGRGQYDTRAGPPADRDHDQEADEVHRRALLLATGALTGAGIVDHLLGLLDPDDGDLLLAALREPGRHLGERVVRLVERQDARLQRRTGTLPAAQRFRYASQHLVVVQRLRPAATRAGHARRLAVVEVQASRLLGRLVGYWRGDPAGAARLFGVALAAAHDAGPAAPTLRAYTLGGLAYLHAELGDRRLAVPAATQALTVAESSPVRALPSWLWSTAALAHAGVADRRACADALAAAADQFAPPGSGDPLWLQGFVTQGLLVENRAACQLRLGRPTAALAALAEAERLVLARPGRIQQYAVLLAHRAEALVRDRQLADGCQAAIDALAIAGPIGYGLAVEQVRRLWRGRLASHRRQVPGVRDVEELLRLAQTSTATPAG
jgi:transcriptional regulator with XRE-family HTH domain